MENRPNTERPTMTAQLMRNKFWEVSMREKYFGKRTGARAKMMTRTKVKISDHLMTEKREVNLAMLKLKW